MTVKNSFSKIVEMVFTNNGNEMHYRDLTDIKMKELNEALMRLKKSKAWAKLEDTPLSESYLSNYSKHTSDLSLCAYDMACFFCISDIKHSVIDVLTLEPVQTPKDKSDDCLEIASLIKRLKILLNKHPFLDTDIDNPTIYEAAMERISEGVRINSMSLPKEKLSEGAMFADQIESELDQSFKLQSELIFNFKDVKLNTYQAYEILKNYPDNNDLFSLLERIEGNARQTANSPDETYSRKNYKNFLINKLANELSNIFVRVFGKPLHSITADFSSSVFNVEVDENSISRNWRRKRKK